MYFQNDRQISQAGLMKNTFSSNNAVPLSVSLDQSEVAGSSKRAVSGPPKSLEKEIGRRNRSPK